MTGLSSILSLWDVIDSQAMKVHPLEYSKVISGEFALAIIILSSEKSISRCANSDYDLLELQLFKWTLSSGCQSTSLIN